MEGQFFSFSNIIYAPSSLIPQLIKLICYNPLQSSIASATNEAPKLERAASLMSIIVSLSSITL
jgi:hypothetical protein